MSTVLERVRSITAEKLSIKEDQIEPSSSFTEHLMADSLDVVELIMAFEEEFGSEDSPMEISDEDAEKILTVSDAVNYIKSRGVED